MTALAVDSKTRSPLLPDVPTLTELGYGDNLTRLYFGIVAPAGTPSADHPQAPRRVRGDRQRSRIQTEAMIDVALEPVFDTPEEFARFLKEDRAASARIVQDAGMEPQ